jgi:arylsulfatase A-like enzyme
MEVPSDASYSGEPWPQPQKNHAAMIARLNGDVGKVLARLRELGLEENTIVFFASFHEGGLRQAVRVDDWKAVRLAPSKPLELYDLKVDQGEAHNIAADQPGVVTKIEAYLKTARTE